MERRRAARGREAGSPEEDELYIGEERRKYYADKARREGKTVEEVTPPKQLELERRAAALKKRQRAAAERRREAAEPKVGGRTLEERRRDAANKRRAMAEAKAAEAKAADGKAADGKAPTPPARKSTSNIIHTDDTIVGPFPGDPPFIDGYNPEEESCVSGNWCGDADAVAAVAVPSVPVEMACAIKIAGGKSSPTIEGDPKTYEGLSSASNMQGTLNQHGTELARASSRDATMCCYHWFEYCSGRPHLAEDGPVFAPVEPGGAWGSPTADDPLSPVASAAVRERLAQQWRHDAQAEHASVAAFARATLELMAVGAPAELLAGALQAGLDEVDHARRCFALAGRYGGTPVQPGALAALPPREPSLAQLAADTFAEGCVGETIAALVAHRAARSCDDVTVRESLEQIADDEAQHAALAWSTIAWAVRQGGDPVTERLELAARSLREGMDARPRPAADPDADTLAQHGRLDDRAHHDAAREAWDDVIGPMLRGLLADDGQAAPMPIHA